jgi:NAD(P)-dependent dehydrogenase (short-subunit alcohol dehydrogenase family)
MMRTVTVLGAGTMGAQIAAHAANAGLEVTVLDVSAEAARDGMKRAAALRPDPFFTRAHAPIGSLLSRRDATRRNSSWVACSSRSAMASSRSTSSVMPSSSCSFCCMRLRPSRNGPRARGACSVSR